MFSRDYLRARQDRRARRRIDPTALEALEERQLMAYSSLGFSLPDLQNTGRSAPITTWGGTLTLRVNAQNTGASTIVEPLALIPRSQVQSGPDGQPSPPYALNSSADAVGTQVAVYLAPAGRPRRGLTIGTIAAPALYQNSITEFNADVTLPSRPPGFPAHGRYVIRLLANADRSTLEQTYRNNLSPAIPVSIQNAPATPQLRAVALDVPPGLQPGDTVAPYIQIANLGSGAIPAGTPVEVALVASTTPDFNLGSSIISVYTLTDGVLGANSAPGLSPHFRRHPAAGLRNSIVTPRNVVAIQGGFATLPTSPGKYYLGVVVDPYNKLDLPNQPTNRLELPQLVQTGNSSGLPPSGVVGSPNDQPFPNPPDGVPIGVV